MNAKININSSHLERIFVRNKKKRIYVMLILLPNILFLLETAFAGAFIGLSISQIDRNKWILLLQIMLIAISYTIIGYLNAMCDEERKQHSISPAVLDPKDYEKINLWYKNNLAGWLIWIMIWIIIILLPVGGAKLWPQAAKDQKKECSKSNINALTGIAAWTFDDNCYLKLNRIPIGQNYKIYCKDKVDSTIQDSQMCKDSVCSSKYFDFIVPVHGLKEGNCYFFLKEDNCDSIWASNIVQIRKVRKDNLHIEKTYLKNGELSIVFKNMNPDSCTRVIGSCRSGKNYFDIVINRPALALDTLKFPTKLGACDSNKIEISAEETAGCFARMDTVIITNVKK